MDFENLVLLVMSENYLFLVALQERPANVNILVNEILVRDTGTWVQDICFVQFYQ
jgi:hypothetical protein